VEYLQFHYQEEKQVYIGKGVLQNTDGTYSPNTTSITAENWYYYNAFRRDNDNSFDASYVKLREVSLNYRLSDKWTKVVKMQNISGLVGNNLALWTKFQTLTQKLKP
jgi:hypothetical protein